MTRHEPSIRHRYGSTLNSRRDADDEGTNGLHDEHPQRTGV